MLHNLTDAAARRLGRHGFSEARYTQAVDQLIAAYVYWLEEEIAAEEAYSRCGTTRGPTRRRAFAVYFAALDREERAAAEYATCVDEVSAIISPGEGLLVLARAASGASPSRSLPPKERL
jgi:hypothetical protein